jgi:replicative DNA helicase
METIETIILRNLIQNDEYTRRALPFVDEEYFKDRNERVVFGIIRDHIHKYNKAPNKDAIGVALDNRGGLSEQGYKDCTTIATRITDSESSDETDWLLDETEKFCKDKAVYNAIIRSIEIIDGKSQNETKNAIPNILSDALAVSFDQQIGHDYFIDADERFDFYHKVEHKIPFDLDMFNKITNGGVPNKTLNVILAGTGVGKSLFMCHHAANCYSANLNVLYITCEMAEQRIAERIDANLMDVTMDDLRHLPKITYDKKLQKATANIKSKLIVKEYPTATANVNHFRHLLEELKLKKNFTPDVVFIDYLNICASARFKIGGNTNSYMYIKSIAEELRGLAVEWDVPIFTATQTNRTGFASNDFGLEDTSESFGLPATADLMFGLIATEELDEQSQIMVKQLKNRYNDVATNKKFVVGINRGKMKLHDVSNADKTFVGAGQDPDDLVDSAGVGFNGQNFDEKFKSSKSKFNELRFEDV